MSCPSSGCSTIIQAVCGAKVTQKHGNHGGFRAFQGKNMENMMISHGILKGYRMEHHGIFMGYAWKLSNVCAMGIYWDV